MSLKDPSPSDFGSLVDRVEKLETGVLEIKSMVKENTDMTKDIKDMLPTIKNLHEMGIFARIGKRVVVGIAAVVVTTAGMAASWKSIIAQLQSLGK